MDEGVSNRGTQSKGYQKRKHSSDDDEIVSILKKPFEQLPEEKEDEEHYEIAMAAGSQVSVEHVMEDVGNASEGYSTEYTPDVDISWQEFREKLIKNISLFDGNLKNLGRTATQFVVGVAEGRKENVLEVIRRKITPHTDNIEIVEIKEDQDTTFLGGNGQSRVIYKHIKSGDKIVNVATEDYNKSEACLQSGLAGTLTLLMEDPEHKYYGIAPGHVFIEEFKIEMLTKKFKSFPCRRYSRTVVCNVEYKDPRCERQKENKVLAQEVFGGMESFENRFMDCGWFEVNEANKEYLEFHLENIDSLPTVFKDKLVCGTEVCSINSMDVPAVDGKIVMIDHCWFLGDGEDFAVLCDMFLVEGKDGCFACPGNSGKVVHDKDGNIFGMVIAYDRKMQQKYPHGVAICIKLEHVLDYIAKKGGPKLDVARQLESSTSSNTGHPSLRGSSSASGAQEIIPSSKKSREVAENERIQRCGNSVHENLKEAKTEQNRKNT